jgi:EmrB/QacA subfamily drug resistance transporter
MNSSDSKRRRWLILAVLGTAQLMVVLDATVVNIALPSAQRALHFSNENRQWIITAYALAFGSLLLLGGRLSDWFGRKWTLIAGLSGFALASAAGGAAQSFEVLVAARAVQGIFGALLAPAALSILTTTFTEPAERAKAFGVFAAIAASGSSIGLLIGGALTQSLSWRYCMYVNVVFAAVAVTGAIVLLRNSRPATRPRLDITGTAAVSAGLFALVYASAHAQTTSWGDQLTIGMLAGGVLLLGLFVALETRVRTPLLPPRIVASRNRGASFVSIGIAGGTVFAAILFLTYYLQQTRGYAPITTGLAFLPMTVTIMTAALLGLTQLQPRFGPRTLIAAGMALGTAGTLCLTQLRVNSSYAGEILPALIVFGAGLGLVFSTSLSNATLGVAPSDAGVASATVNASQQVGGSLGIALLSTIAASASANYLAHAQDVPDLAGHTAVHGYDVGFAWLAGILAASTVVCATLFTRRARGHGCSDRRSGVRHRVVVVGGGFGGLQAALKLARLPVDVTLIDRRNFHFFQPLAYQVATGALSAAEITYPLRRVFRRRDNVRVLLAEVTDIDLDAHQLTVRPAAGDRECDSVGFDALIVAAGSHYNYFHHDRWQPIAPDLKTPESALEIRARILRAFEAAVLEPDPARRAAWLTFVVVGAGPTGVEMAGQIAEIARDLRGDFPSLDSSQARIVLVEAGERVLGAFPPSLSAKAQHSLARLGVSTLLNHTVVELDARSVTLVDADDAREQITARTVVWAAGVIASRLAGVLADRAGLEVDSAGRVEVLEDLSLPGHPNVLAIGDMIRIRQADGSSIVLPGLAPVAMQQGRHAARVVRDRLHGRPPRRFRYHDKGNLATIGRASAVAEVKHFRLSGFLAWITWLTVHLWYLIGFENRVLVVTRWAFSFVTHGRGARLITDPSHRSTTGARAPVAFLPAAPRQHDEGEQAGSARKHKCLPSPAQPFPSLNTDEAAGL